MDTTITGRVLRGENIIFQVYVTLRPNTMTSSREGSNRYLPFRTRHMHL